jgi:hypothetical protein
MRVVRPFIGLIGVGLLIIGARASAQVAMPEGPNRALVSRACSGCHDLGTAISIGGQSREDWNRTIDDMIPYGMDVTQEERRQILDYLATAFPASTR